MMREKTKSRNEKVSPLVDMKIFNTRSLILGTLVLVWFLSFAFQGIFADFSGDDMMNLDYYDQQGGLKTILATLQVITPFYRPLGGVFYLGAYTIFGVNPLPYRLACFALLLGNMILFYRFFRLLTGRRDLPWIALFLVSYHAWFVDLYYSSGTIYELLCVFFYLWGFTTYVKIRSSGEHLQAKHWLLVACCYAAALDSKELAVTLPLFIGLFELIYNPSGSIRRIGMWISPEGSGFLALAVLTIPYIWVKTAAGSIAENPMYTPRISARVFMHTFQIYLNPFFYLDQGLRGGSSMVLLGLLLLIALIARRRHLLFGWLFLVLSVLPFIFIPHHAAFFLYLPALGWALMGAGFLVMLKDSILITAAKVMRVASPAGWTKAIVLGILLMPLGLCLIVAHYRESQRTLAHFMNAQVPLSPLIEGLRVRCADVKAGTVLWFRRDPFPRDSYTLEQTVRLTCHDRNAHVVRGDKPPQGKLVPLSYDGKRLVDDTNR